MPYPGLQIYIQPYVALTFDIQSPNVDRFVLLPRVPLVQICIKNRFIHFLSPLQHSTCVGGVSVRLSVRHTLVLSQRSFYRPVAHVL